jgi:hypothetical protein
MAYNINHPKHYGGEDDRMKPSRLWKHGNLAFTWETL